MIQFSFKGRKRIIEDWQLKIFRFSFLIQICLLSCSSLIYFFYSSSFFSQFRSFILRLFHCHVILLFFIFFIFALFFYFSSLAYSCVFRLFLSFVFFFHSSSFSASYYSFIFHLALLFSIVLTIPRKRQFCTHLTIRVLRILSSFYLHIDLRFPCFLYTIIILSFILLIFLYSLHSHNVSLEIYPRAYI